MPQCLHLQVTDRVHLHAVREKEMKIFVLSTFDGVTMDGHGNPIFWVVDANIYSFIDD